MRFIVLAVTKSWDGFCIAGMNEDGEWIRPISRASAGRFWTREELTIDGRFVRAGDVWEINGQQPAMFEYPNHTEDFYVIEWSFEESLTHTELLEFLEDHCEGEEDLADVFAANGRSLCLVKVDRFTHYSTHYEDKHRARMIFSSEEFDMDNPRTRDGNIIVKDCKWEGQILRNGRIPAAYEQIYVCIGNATPYNGVEYPQVIGLHTSPHLAYSNHYPD